ncbi:SIMPL domain-containing protein [Escherichia coli]|nr:SIMPL domain-containing protein [Escherichia coli]
MKSKVLIAAIAAAMMTVPAAAFAQAQQTTPRIIVVGEGESSIKPDMALLTLTVMQEAATARQAMTANNDIMAKVISAMKEAGVAEADLQTAGLQINPRYDYTDKPDGTQEAHLAAYQVTNTIAIRVRDIAKTGEILDKAVTLGVNQGGSIAFTNDDPSQALTEARKKAVANAMAKAKTLAEAAGVTLGKVVELSETSFEPQPIAIVGKAYARDAAGQAPIEAGENNYRIQVNMTFEMK